MPTKISTAQANKIFNASLFTESTRFSAFAKMMTGEAPKTFDDNKANASVQTNAGAPIVRITDLTKSKGDEVTVDLVAQPNQKPVMGDDKLAGKGASIKFSEFSLKVDQGRTMIDSGGRMSQQRTKHDMKNLARRLIAGWYSRKEDQECVVHLAGARGDATGSSWIVPLESDPDFAKIMVNPVRPPTFDRHFYGGNATGLGDIDGADIFSLAEVDNIRLRLDEMENPLMPIKFEGDQQAEDSPFYVLNVTPRQWNDFWTSTDGAVWRTLTADARTRAGDFNHPVFKGECVMWHNILIKKNRTAIRFNAGSDVSVSTDSVNAATTTATPGVNVDRAILLGGQALANAYGTTSKNGGYHFSSNEEDTDHGNVVEHSISWMNGKSKIRFEGSDGRMNDFGVAVLDTATS